ncbi:MAG TPA: glycosyltransferase [Candidatus Saccharimonadales bacterium]|nr:glycosyltransferase [Candidatus Saccharimonadales bacterium]
MYGIFILLAASAMLEFVLYISGFWRARKILAVLAMITTMFSVGAVFMWRPNVLSSLIVLAAAYRVINQVRIYKGRMHERYLHRAAFRTSWHLMTPQFICLLAWWGWYQSPINRRTVWLSVAVLQVFVAAVFLLSTWRRIKRTHPALSHKNHADAELPSISIAVPARNETEDLHECLASILASDYPKFEVLVLDDCSQNKRTPEIIRSFAHAGVRFLQGDEPRETWLAKNQAYDQLARESSGEYILFCGVDVRFQPDTIRKIVATIHDRKKEMISILPERTPDARGRAALIQAMRYWWELVPPRRLFNRPPVLSSCWIIKKQALHRVGGFAAVTRAIVPEAFFARQLLANDGYSFIRSNNVLGLQSVKTPAEQRDTAIRMRYPQLHKRPEQVFVASVLESTFLILPFVMALAGFWLPISPLTQSLSAIAAVLLTISYELMAQATRINHWSFALVALPMMSVLDIAVMQRSMWLYEFSEVIWKGRNVCLPVMHVTPHLPRLENTRQ